MWNNISYIRYPSVYCNWNLNLTLWNISKLRNNKLCSRKKRKNIQREETCWNKMRHSLFFYFGTMKKRVFVFPRYFFILFYTQRCYHVPRPKRWAFFYGKIGRLNFRQRVTGNRKRNDICTGETGTGRQSDKRPGCIDRRKCSWTYYAVISGGSAISIAIFSARSRNTFMRAPVSTPLSPPNFPSQGILPINLSLVS